MNNTRKITIIILLIAAILYGVFVGHDSAERLYSSTIIDFSSSWKTNTTVPTPPSILPTLPNLPPISIVTISDPNTDERSLSKSNRIDGGLSCPVPDDFIYWSHIASDYTFPLPYREGKHEKKYVTFEPDIGGWNNIRMAMETILVFAHITNRILVLPPAAVFYLLNKNSKFDENKSTFNVYFRLDLLNSTRSPHIISMEDFLQTEAINENGIIYHMSKQNPSIPQLSNHNLTMFGDHLWKYLRPIGKTPEWKIGKSCVWFDFRNLSIYQDHRFARYNNSQEDADAALFAGGRRTETYSNDLVNAPIIHFPNIPSEGYRWLNHFYTFFHFSPIPLDDYVLRFVRDRLYYREDIMCAAAAVVKFLRSEAGDDGSGYVAMHVRRGDFQYKETQVSAKSIHVEIDDIVREYRKSIGKEDGQIIVYIATDEKNKTFFDPLISAMEEAKVFFLSNLVNKFSTEKLVNVSSSHETDSLSVLLSNMNYIGMIEQLICSHADIFFGTPLSTFTGYITRLRGYIKSRQLSRRQNHLTSLSSLKTYYFLKSWKFVFEKKGIGHDMYGPYWGREFPRAFQDIDDDDDDDNNSTK